MARSTRIRPLSRDLALAVQRSLSPEARKGLIAAAASRALQQAQEQNARVLGTVPRHDTFVDGRQGAALETVNPDHGEIVFRFSLATDLFSWVDEQLILHSPIGPRPKAEELQFNRSHIFFADGEQSDPYAPAQGDVFIFLNTRPYARKIERGLSDQAPEGVYEVVAALANRRFGNVARITFGYRSFQSGAIVYNAGAITLRKQIAAERGLSASDARREASALIRAERDTRQPAIIITIR